MNIIKYKLGLFLGQVIRLGLLKSSFSVFYGSSTNHYFCLRILF